MKKGILVYTKSDAKLNKWFISHITEELEKQNIKLELLIYGENVPHDIDFCINRSRLCSICETLEQKGIRCFNNKETVKIANDKWLTYKLCKSLNIPVMETKEADCYESFNPPFVLKSRNGHGGSEVMLINDADEINSMNLRDTSRYIVQKLSSTTGVDVRIYVLGGKAVCGVKRASEKDFRSNFSLGGKVELFTPEKEQLEIVRKLQQHLKTDYAGFDFILHNGKWVLNEIEDAVGARMLYSLSDKDIVKEYAEYITERLV